ncbi:MAG: hypothetical protein RMJ67_06640 [Elusimicrobiota bacterium]|nr:hypothetical protein [Endomicrobiia bacterium]MDW8166171.1 hypothetical protein [Elusimicrobiota bacterium]
MKKFEDVIKKALIGGVKKPAQKKKKTKKLKKPIILLFVKKQTGKSKKKVDKRYKALKPGKRMSKYGNIYHEHRRNRSDLDMRKKL